MKYSWNFTSQYYVSTRIEGKAKFMHVYLMNKEENDERVIDHINNIKHDNRLSNLRLSTLSENCHNRVKKEGTSSKYYGVTYHKTRKFWRAYITKDKKMNRIGNFKTEIEAAKAYNEKAKELYDDKARLNIIEEDDEEEINNNIKNIDISNIPSTSTSTDIINLNTITEFKNQVDEIKNNEVLKEIRERKSRFRGVTFSQNRYIAEIFKDNQRYYLGTYDTDEDAARAYNKKSKELYGDQAFLNDVEGDIEIVGHKQKSSKYRGVSYNKKYNNWKVILRKDYKEVHAGTYKTEEEAALAYNKKAKEIHGDKAKLNIIS